MDIIIQNLNLSLIASGLQESHLGKYKPMTKENCTDGVFICTASGLWLPQFFGLCSEKAVAIALVKEGKKLMISLSGSEKDLILLADKKKTSIKQYSSVDEALTDNSGINNTEELIKADSEAAKFCKETGTSWYIPTLAEMNLMFTYKKEIDSAITIAGGEPLYYGWHWTSTRYSDGSYWIFYWVNGNRNIDSQIDFDRVRPVSAFL